LGLIVRKTDYQTLARLLAEQLSISRASARVQTDNTLHQAECRASIGTVESIGRRFAIYAHVDGPTFLKACGIDT
jgi:hypothetical protein